MQVSIAVVTGSSGSVGSEAVKFLHQQGMQVVGIDNDMRRYFMVEDGSTAWNTRHLQESLRNLQHYPIASEIFGQSLLHQARAEAQNFSGGEHSIGADKRIPSLSVLQNLLMNRSVRSARKALFPVSAREW